MSSTAEYLDMEVEMGKEVNLQEVFNSFLPTGLQILQYQGIFSKTAALAATINRATYQVAIPSFDVKNEWIDDALASAEVMITRLTKDGEKQINIRPYIHAIDLKKDVMDITLDRVENRAIKISEVLNALLLPKEIDYRRYFVQRTGQFIVNENGVFTPFENV